MPADTDTTDVELAVVDRRHDVTAAGQMLPTLAELERAEALATRIAHSGMVPKTLRGDAGAVLAVMLSGRELSIGAMQALRDIDYIDGKPAASAKLQRELLRRAGHELELLSEADDREAARYRFRRAEWPADRWIEWSFTMQQARDAGLTGKDNWKKYPAAMLRHRALSSLATEWCPEVLGAVQYTADELGATVDVEGRVVSVEQIDRSERSTVEQAWMDLLERADAFSPAAGRYLRDQRAEAAGGAAFSAMATGDQETWVQWGERALASAIERRGDTQPTQPAEEVEEADGEIVDDPTTAPPADEHAEAQEADVVEEPWRQSAAQRRKLQATLAEAHVDDDLRHTLAGVVSGGRTRSTSELGRREFDQLLALSEYLRDETVTVDYDQDGTLLLAWSPARGGGPVDPAELTS